jgi:hypothetical protein
MHVTEDSNISQWLRVDLRVLCLPLDAAVPSSPRLSDQGTGLRTFCENNPLRGRLCLQGQASPRRRLVPVARARTSRFMPAIWLPFRFRLTKSVAPFLYHASHGHLPSKMNEGFFSEQRFAFFQFFQSRLLVLKRSFCERMPVR